MEIINFINNNGKLKSKPILKKWKEIYPNQNNGILGEDILKFVQLFNDDVELIDDNNYKISSSNCLFYVLNGSHMFYLYNNFEEKIIEKWDPSTFQKTTNNCTLYCGILAIIRPFLTFQETRKLIKKLDDSKDSESCYKLAEISNYFFNRGIDKFNYNYN